MPTFPTFRQVGAAIDMPVAPLQYKPLNFTGLIDTMLKKESLGTKQKQPSAKKEDEFKLIATTGMAKQWQDQMDAIQNEKNQLASFYGAENFAYMPEYRQLVAQEEKLQTPFVLNAAQNVKDQVDQAQNNVATAKAENYINIPYLLQTGLGVPNIKLLEAQESGYNVDFAITKPIPIGQGMYNPDVTLNVEYYNDKSAQEHINNITQNLGSDKVRIESAWNEITAGLDPSGTTFGSTNTATQNVREYFTNNGKFEVDANGNISLDKDRLGALQEANVLALQSLFTGATSLVNPTSPLSGIFQGFLQGTKGTNTAGFTKGFAKESKFQNTEALVKRKYTYTDEDLKELGITDKDEIEKYKNLETTHKGYYYSQDIKDKDGKLIALQGQLDVNLLSRDFYRYATDFIGTALNVKVQDVRSIVNKQETKFDEYSQGSGTANNIVQTDSFANGGTQYRESSVVKMYDGVTEDELKTMLSDNTVFGLYSTSLGKTEDEKMKFLAGLGDVSPFLVSVSNGVKKYSINEDFDSDEVQKKLIKIYTDQGDTQTIATNKANAQVQNMQSMWTKVRESNLGSEGLTSTNATTYNWDQSYTIGYFNGDIEKNLKVMFDPNTENGTTIYKTGQTLTNQKVKVGTEYYNGAYFIGSGQIVERMNNIVLQRSGIPKNAGFRIKDGQSFTHASRTYTSGDFVHASILDTMDDTKSKELMGKSEIGNGYWTVDRSKVIGAASLPDLSASKTIAWGPKSEKLYAALVTQIPGNEVYRAPYQYGTEVVVRNEKDKQLKEWKDKGIMISIEDYTYKDKEAQKYWDKAEISKGKSIIKMDLSLSYTSYTLDRNKLVDLWKSDISESKINAILDKYDKNGYIPANVPTQNKIRQDIANALAGTSLNWDSKTKRLTPTRLVDDNGYLNRQAAKIIGIREDGKNVEYNTIVEIAGIMSGQFTEGAAKKGLNNFMTTLGTNQTNTGVNFNPK